jgi:pimeloyl-ACP methyl ester carboxylesterase
MARDMVQLMYVYSPPPIWSGLDPERADRRSTLGFSSFSVAGHDRGGRVAHRMALDYPEKVERLMVLDIAPTLFAFEHMTHTSVSLSCISLVQKGIRTDTDSRHRINGTGSS